MAITSKGFYCDVNARDSDGDVINMRYKLNSADAEEAATDAGTIVAAIAGVSDLAIHGYRVGELFEDETVLFAAAGVEAEKQALITARIDANTLKFASLRIPAPKAALFKATTGPASKEVKTDLAALQAYLTMFATAGICQISEGEALLSPGTEGNVKGHKMHRGNRDG